MVSVRKLQVLQQYSLLYCRDRNYYFDKARILRCKTYSTFSGGSGYNEGTHYNVKLLNDGTTTWDGATAKVVVGTGGTITDVSFISRGSGYTDAEELDFDTSVLGSGTGAGVTISSSGISTNIGDAIQITGIGTTGEGYYKIASIPSKNQVSIAITAGDIEIHSGQYLLNLGPSVHVTQLQGSVRYYNLYLILLWIYSRI